MPAGWEVGVPAFAMREEGGGEVVVRYARRGLASCPSCLLSSFLGSEYTRPLVLVFRILGSGTGLVCGCVQACVSLCVGLCFDCVSLCFGCV